MLFGHIRRNTLHLKLAGGAVCQMKRIGVYAWLTVRFDGISEWLTVCVYVCGLFLLIGERVFICMCLLTGGSVPGPAHLFSSPNWWHHRNSMIRLILIAAAVAAVSVALGRPSSPVLHTHTHIEAFSLQELQRRFSDRWTLWMSKCWA